MGVPAVRAATTAEFAAGLSHALAEPGPHLIEAVPCRQPASFAARPFREPASRPRLPAELFGISAAHAETLPVARGWGAQRGRTGGRARGGRDGGRAVWRDGGTRV